MEKLIKIQDKLEVPKKHLNKFGGYHYRSAEDILEALKPLLREQKLLLTLTDKVVKKGARYYVKATATLYDGENKLEVSAYAREAKTKKGMDEAQITGSASSYARKYALNGMFAIDDTKDADATNTHQTAPERTGAKKTTKTGKVTSPQIKMIMGLLSELGAQNDADKKELFKEITGKDSVKELTIKEASAAIGKLQEANGEENISLDEKVDF